MHPLLELPWQATLVVERKEASWVVRATAGPVDKHAASAHDTDDHEWWLGLAGGGRTRWSSSSFTRSEESFVDDAPSVGELWIPAEAGAEVVVELWIELVSEGAQTVRALRARRMLTSAGTIDLTLAVVDEVGRPEIAPDTFAAPREVLALPGETAGMAYAVLPGLGVVEFGGGEWALATPTQRLALPGFAPERDARAEAFTAGPDGNLAVVWRIRNAWHLALYRLPMPAPRLRIPPSPHASGNPPQTGVFTPDGSSLVVPVSGEELGVIDVASGSIRYRVPAGYVGHAAWSVTGEQLWVASPGRVQAYALTDGALLDDLESMSLYGGEAAFSAGAGRLAWVEVLDHDAGLSAITWQDLGGAVGQLFVRDELDGRPCALPGGDLVVAGRRGLWHVDPDGRTAVRVTEALMLQSVLPVAERTGDLLVVWTADAEAYQLVVAAEPRTS